MLKWTVMNKRTSTTATTLPSINGGCETSKENTNNINSRKTPKGLRHSQQHNTAASSVQRRHTFNKNLNKLKTPSSANRRHSHAGGSDKKWDKENQFFNSTPKTKDTISYIRFDTIALRDVSNITPTNSTPPGRNIICNKRCRSQPHENKYLSIKRSETNDIRNKLTFTPPSSHRPFTNTNENTPSTKKLCLRHPNSPHLIKKATRRSLQTTFELPTPSKNVLSTYPGKEFIQQIRENEPLPPAVEIIENTLAGEKLNTYASTLPTFQIEYSPCPMRPTQSLLGISKAVPQGTSMLPPYKSVGMLPNFNNEILSENCPSIKKSKIDYVNDFLTRISSVASPEDIGMQFTDLKKQATRPLTSISVTPLANRFADLRFSKILNDSINSDEFDKLPLDQMVEEILENTTCIKESTPKKENDLNETQEDNYVNLEQEKKQCEIRNTDPKLNNLVLNAKVVVNSNLSPETYNEREVKTPEHKLSETPSKLSFENLNICSSRKGIKRSNSATENSTDNSDGGFTLKRQKCVRRKRFEFREANNNALVLDNGIPSPNSACKNVNQNNSITKSSNFNLISIDQEIKFKRRPIVLPDEPLTPKSDLDIEQLLRENLEETPLSLFPGYRKINSRQNILTLPEGIPSPGTPLSSLKKRRVGRKLSPKVLSDTFVIDPERSQMFGLTLENGIPSPPVCALEKKPDRSFEVMDTPYSDPWTPVLDDKKIKTRRCLDFLSPDSSLDLDLRSSEKCTPVVRRCKSKDNFTARGSIDLSMRYENNRLLVHVIGCKDLYRPNEKSVNAYVKVSLISGTSTGENDSTGKERSAGGLHRTAVHKNSTNPHFDQMFCFDILTKTDLTKRLQIAVWHRDREYRRSEFLGCTTFAVKHAIKKEISGSFKLQSQPTNRAPQHLPPSGQSNSNISIPQQQQLNITSTITTENQQTLVPSTCSSAFPTPPNEIVSSDKEESDTPINHNKELLQNDSNNHSMGDFSQSSVEEIVSLDEMQDIVTQDLGKSSSKKKLNEQQKVADENIFLRYLELDPTEGPEAIPAALQRKASGNKSGRTPFTTTKRLTRPPDSGFGFSVVWTHPPRVERVERGLPAERAGILPGDYIIFVDKHNVVMMPEVEILNLIRSYGNQLTLEVYRRQGNIATNICGPGGGSTQNGLVSSSRSASVTIVAPGIASALGASIAPTTGGAIVSMVGGSSSIAASTTQQPRSSTACSINTTSDYNRRRLHLPQVTFSSENTTTGGAQSPEDVRKRTLYQLIHREQQYATAMQFSMGRFVAPLAERTDLLAPTDHRALFQNSQDLLQLTEEILDHIILEDGEPHVHLIPKVYSERVAIMVALYKKYCAGIKKADCVLANKTRNTSSEFVRFLHNPTIPRRRPDITGFIHKPLEHYREVLKLLQTVLANTKSNQDDYQMISKVVQELQNTYREITSNSGLMEPVGEGRPLLSIQDLESRLVFTRCKPFVLNVPGRQWIFGGDLSRVEGRNIRPYWALLFSDILLFAKVSRDRVLFITEEPLPLINVTEVFFNIRKKATEFRINITPGGKPAESPTAHCGPDLSRTPRKGARRRCVVLRAPNNELKAVWQNLLQKQIYLVHSGMGLTPLSSPMDSPDAPITSSVATLQSGDSYTFRRQTPTHHQQLQQHNSIPDNSQKQLNELIEHKCRQLGKSGTNKGSALHLAQWIKGELGTNNNNIHADGHGDESADDEGEPEVWTEEELRRRSRELHLIDTDMVINSTNNIETQHRFHNGIRAKEYLEQQRCDSVLLSDADGSPSKSTTSGSQVTVRSSPLVPEKVPVCRQCHKTCLTMHPNSNINRTNNNLNHNSNYCNNQHYCDSELNNNQEINKENSSTDPYSDDWGSLMLMGLSAINPTTSLIQMDPFAPKNTPKKKEVPKISVLPPTPDTLPRSTNDESHFPLTTDQDKTPPKSSPKPSPKRKLQLQKTVIDDESPEDSPQTEEPPYLVMVPKNPGLKRYGTWSSLGRIPSDELVEAPDDIGDEPSSSEEEEDDEENDEDDDDDNIEPITQSIIGWTTRAGSFVAEKMAMFEKLGEESRAAIAGYLRPADSQIESDPEVDLGIVNSGGPCIDDEYENSGATSGEEIWGTPTSGGELDEIPTFPNSQGESLSSPHDSTSSANCDEDDLMMDELLMAPPMTASAVRGLLPRRRLEPLMEEDDTESCTTTGASVPNLHDSTPSPEQVKTLTEEKPIIQRGSEYGDVADTSCAAEDTKQSQTESSTKSTTSTKTPPPPPPRRVIRNTNTTTNKQTSLTGVCSTSEKIQKTGTVERTSSVQQSPTTTPKNNDKPTQSSEKNAVERVKTKKHHPALIRASSYKHIIENDSSLFSTANHNNNNTVLNKTKPVYSKRISSIVNNTTPDIDVEHNVIVNPASCRSKSTRLLEFLSGRRQDDLLMGLDASYAQRNQGSPGRSKQILKLFSRDAEGAHITTFSQRPFSPRRQNDKQLDRRFWKQLQRRRRGSLGSQIPAV